MNKSIKKIISIVFLVLSIVNIVLIVPFFVIMLFLFTVGGMSESNSDTFFSILISLSYMILSVFALIVFVKKVKNN